MRFKDFSIKTKSRILFIMDGILLLLVASAFIYFFLISGLNKTENHNLERLFYQVQALINSKLEVLFNDVKDYATWDDMYNYVNTPDEKWAKINLSDWAIKNFKIDLILIFDAKEKLIYQYGNFEEFQIGKDSAEHYLLKDIFKSRETKGIYPTAKGLMYVTSSQIMHTDESGPRNGTYLYGKFINLNELKAIAGVDLSLITGGKPIQSSAHDELDRPKNLGNIYNKLISKNFGQFIISKPNYQSAFVYSLLKDTEGKPIAMLELIQPRKSISVFRTLIFRVFLLTLFLLILAVFITVSAIINFILKPLHTLKQAIAEIQETKDTLRRVKIESEDETGVLAKDFNLMMDKLNEAHNELIEAQQNLISKEKLAAAAELAIGTVHQINNPLSIVVNRVQLLRRFIRYKNSIPEADLEKDLITIEDQAVRATKITNGLLRYAKPITFRFEKCNINELLKEVIGLLEESLEKGKVKIVENLKTDLPFMQYCDPRQISDVFMNLISNAQQAMADGGTLEISTDYEKRGHQVCIKFKDNGCGIAPEDINKLFAPFFSTKADKSGLGLATSHIIVKGHHGTIEVESQVGVGSTFTVKLPLGGGFNDIA